MFLLERLESFNEAKPRNCLDTNVKRACRGVYPTKKISPKRFANLSLILSAKAGLRKPLERSLSQMGMCPRPSSIEP